MTKVVVPSHLRSYTGDLSEVPVGGDTVDEVLSRLDERYPGMRVRIVDEQDRVRPHIKLFVDGEQVKDLTVPAGETLHILAALSGG